MVVVVVCVCGGGIGHACCLNLPGMFVARRSNRCLYAPLDHARRCACMQRLCCLS